MIRTRHVIVIFVPAIILVFFMFARTAERSPFEKREKVRSQNYVVSIDKPILRPEDGVIGDRVATHTIISYMDVSCDHCAEEYEAITSIIDTYPGSVRFVVKPVATHARGALAHEYLFCAREQGAFEAALDILFANRSHLDQTSLSGYSGVIDLDRHLLDACLSSSRPAAYTAAIAEEGRALGITGVPTTYLNGLPITPPSSAAGWQTLLAL